MPRPSAKQVVIAGLAGGAVLNLIDTPWSVISMVPRMQAFFDAHGLESHSLTGPWFLLVHFWFAIGIAWVYGLIRDDYGRGTTTALVAGLVLLVLNRMFGFGNVLMGTLPLELFLGFSASFVIGSLAAAVTAGAVLDRLSKV